MESILNIRLLELTLSCLIQSVLNNQSIKSLRKNQISLSLKFNYNKNRQTILVFYSTLVC